MDYTRQLGILPPEALEDFSITIIGCGAIGSCTALALGKMGCSRITLFDPQLVEDLNLPNQFFPLDSLGLPKVEALSQLLQKFTDCNPVAEQRAIGGEPLQGLCIVAVDSMGARREIWRGIKDNPAVPLMIDSRVGAEVGLIYCIDPSDREQIEFYESTLHSDDEAIDLPCTARSIIYNSFFIAALIADLVKRYAMEEELPRELIADLKLLTLKSDLSERKQITQRADGIQADVPSQGEGTS